MFGYQLWKCWTCWYQWRELAINCSMFCKQCMDINNENVKVAISERDYHADIDVEFVKVLEVTEWFDTMLLTI